MTRIPFHATWGALFVGILLAGGCKGRGEPRTASQEPAHAPPSLPAPAPVTPAESSSASVPESSSASLPESTATTSADSSARAAPAPILSEPRVMMAYKRRPVPDEAALVALMREFGEDAFQAVLMVNRLDLRHVRAGRALIVPVRKTDPLELSPFPQILDGAQGTPKLVVVSLAVQAFCMYDHGHQLRWGPVSSGRRDSPTIPNLYHANWKARERRSTVNEEWLLRWVINLESRDGISLHQYDLPGYPASHSCVRFLEADAETLYNWVDQWKVATDQRTISEPGTPVLIFGDYDWDHRAPWKQLPEDPEATTLSDSVMNAALMQYMPRDDMPRDVTEAPAQ